MISLTSLLAVNFHRHFLYSSPASRRTYRSGTEEAQYVEDRKVALLLQNEEFLKELRRNEQFLQELNEGEYQLCKNLLRD